MTITTQVRPIDPDNGKPLLMNLLVDDSYSMTPLRRKGIVTHVLNDVVIPNLSKRSSSIRLALGAYSDGKIYSITDEHAYYDPCELLHNKIRNGKFGHDGLNGGTALYATIISGIESCVEAAKIVQSHLFLKEVETQVFVLTDGKETVHNRSPENVRDVISNVPAYINLNVTLAYCKTGDDPIPEEEFFSYALQCGIKNENCFYWNNHGSSVLEIHTALMQNIKTLI